MRKLSPIEKLLCAALLATLCVEVLFPLLGEIESVATLISSIGV